MTYQDTRDMDRFALENAITNQGLIWVLKTIAFAAQQKGMADCPHDLTVALRESNAIYDCVDKIQHGEVEA